MPDNTKTMSAAERFARARVTYNYCGICGHVPKTRTDEPNRAPLRWWDPDDGWKIGSLCRWFGGGPARHHVIVVGLGGVIAGRTVGAGGGDRPARAE